MPDSNEISARVAKVLVHALGVENEDIKPSATLQGDLGAESIDFLDIVFRLEREFMIKIRQDELFSEPLMQAGTSIVHDGQVTDLGLDMLRASLPYADLRELERDRRLNSVNDVFTVDLLSNFIRWKLSGSRESNGELHVPVMASPVLIHQ